MALGNIDIGYEGITYGGLINIDAINSVTGDGLINKVKDFIYEMVGKKDKYIYALAFLGGFNWSQLFDEIDTWYANLDNGTAVKTVTKRQYRYTIVGGLFLNMATIVQKPEDLNDNTSAWAPCPTNALNLLANFDITGISQRFFGTVDVVKLPYDSTGEVQIIVQARSQQKAKTWGIISTSAWSEYTDWGKAGQFTVLLRYDTRVPRLSNLKLEIAKQINPDTGEEYNNPLHDENEVQRTDKTSLNDNPSPNSALRPFINNYRMSYKLTGHLDNSAGVIFIVNNMTKTLLFRNFKDEFNRGLKTLFTSSSYVREGHDFELYREGIRDPEEVFKLGDHILDGILNMIGNNNYESVLDRLNDKGLGLKALINSIDNRPEDDAVSIQDFINYVRDELGLTGSFDVHVHKPETLINFSSDLFLESLIGSTSTVYCNTITPQLSPYVKKDLQDNIIENYLKVDGCDCELSIEISNMEKSRFTFNPNPRDEGYKLDRYVRNSDGTIKTAYKTDDKGNNISDKALPVINYSAPKEDDDEYNNNRSSYEREEPKFLKYVEQANGTVKEVSTNIAEKVYELIYENVSITTETREGIRVPSVYATSTQYNENEGWAIYYKDITAGDIEFKFLENVTLEQLSTNGDRVKLKFKLPQVRHDYVIKVRALNVESGLVGELFLFNYGDKLNYDENNPLVGNQIRKQPYRPMDIDTSLLVAYPVIHTRGAVDVWEEENKPSKAATSFIYATKNGRIGWQQATPFVCMGENPSYDNSKPVSDDNPRYLWQMCD